VCDAVIVEAVRTPVGRRKGGRLDEYSAAGHARAAAAQDAGRGGGQANATILELLP
jgi:acetyl-CoA acetyltransferase